MEACICGSQICGKLVRMQSNIDRLEVLVTGTGLELCLIFGTLTGTGLLLLYVQVPRQREENRSILSGTKPFRLHRAAVASWHAFHARTDT